jgi:hypothetical protein
VTSQLHSAALSQRPKDYREAADNALELAKALSGWGGISYEDVVSKWAAEHKRRWEKSKFFKLWQEEQKAGRDPHQAFQERGWEP